MHCPVLRTRPPSCSRCVPIALPNRGLQTGVQIDTLRISNFRCNKLLSHHCSTHLLLIACHSLPNYSFSTRSRASCTARSEDPASFLSDSLFFLPLTLRTHHTAQHGFQIRCYRTTFVLRRRFNYCLLQHPPARPATPDGHICQDTSQCPQRYSRSISTTPSLMVIPLAPVRNRSTIDLGPRHKHFHYRNRSCLTCQ